MNWLAGLAFVACLLAGDTFAQAPLLGPPAAEASSPMPFEPVFRARPSAADVARRYPPDAWNNQQEGRVLLCCLVRDDGRLACAAVAESPAGMGFGEAARILSLRYRLTDGSAAQWRADGRVLRLPINFRAERGARPAPPMTSNPSCGPNR